MKETRVNVKIDEKLKDDLKLIALLNKETVTDVVIKGIKTYIKENKHLLD